MEYLVYGFIWSLANALLICSWVNIAMIAASLGMLLFGKQREWEMLAGIAGFAAALLIVQADDLVFAGGLVSSFVGMVAAGLFFSLMLDRKDDPFYNTIRAMAFVLLIPTSIMNLVVFGGLLFLRIADLWL